MFGDSFVSRTSLYYSSCCKPSHLVTTGVLCCVFFNAKLSSVLWSVCSVCSKHSSSRSRSFCTHGGRLGSRRKTQCMPSWFNVSVCVVQLSLWWDFALVYEGRSCVSVVEITKCVLELSSCLAIRSWVVYNCIVPRVVGLSSHHEGRFVLHFSQCHVVFLVIFLLLRVQKALVKISTAFRREWLSASRCFVHAVSLGEWLRVSMWVYVSFSFLCGETLCSSTMEACACRL